MDASIPSASMARRLLVPFLLLLIVVLAHLLAGVWAWADWPTAHQGKVQLVAVILTFLAPVLFLLWLFLLSPFSWPVRGTIFGLFLLVLGGLAAMISEVRVTGNLEPSFYFRWQPQPEQQLVEHRTQQEKVVQELPPIDLTVTAQSFPRYRGQDGTGVVHGVKLASDWAKNPPRQLWRQPAGGGFSGFAVAGNVLVTHEQRGEEEVVVCYDQETGRERWKHTYSAIFRDPTGNGPRATPTIDDGKVFTLGATGWLVCLDGKTGNLLWEVDILVDNGAKRVIWGMTSSPLVVGNKVIVNAGIDPANNQKKAVAAYDRENGHKIWASGGHPAGYSSPHLVTLAGRQQILLFDGGGLAGYDPENGRELWRYPWSTSFDMNIVQPLVLGDRVYIASEASNGGTMLKVRPQGDTFVVEPLWANHHLSSKFSNPVARDGALYGLSNGWLVCVDAETGQRRWRGKNYGHGQVLLVGDQLLVCGEKGELALVAAVPDSFQERARIEVFKDRTWNTPALVGRRLYWRNDVEMVCYELPGAP